MLHYYVIHFYFSEKTKSTARSVPKKNEITGINIFRETIPAIQ